ncbi:MAG: START domain-containing protein [Myxococcota bacterium]
MISLALVPILLLGADQPRWELAADPDGVKVYRRDKDGSAVKEMKAIGLIDGTPKEVWDVVRDLENYPKQMPYTAEAKVLSRSEGDKEILFYSRLNTPLVSERDYLIVLKDESEWNDGKGFYKVSWTIAPPEKDSLMPEKKDVVRVRVNDGYWLLEPREDGKKTFATYYVFTAPGGSIPTFIINQANGMAVPKVFEAIKKTVVEKRKQK